MAAVDLPNGAPEPPALSLTHKRKHSAVEAEHMNGVVMNGDGKPLDRTPLSSSEYSGKMASFMTDLLVVLERYIGLSLLIPL